MVTHLASTVLFEFNQPPNLVTIPPFFFPTKDRAERLVHVANNENLGCKGLFSERGVEIEGKAAGAWVPLAALAPNVS
jgi:hypothetical protein